MKLSSILISGIIGGLSGFITGELFGPFTPLWFVANIPAVFIVPAVLILWLENE